MLSLVNLYLIEIGERVKERGEELRWGEIGGGQDAVDDGGHGGRRDGGEALDQREDVRQESVGIH